MEVNSSAGSPVCSPDLTHPNFHLFLDSLYRLYREGEGGEGDDVEEGGLGGGGGDLDQQPGSMWLLEQPVGHICKDRPARFFVLGEEKNLRKILQ